MKPTPTPHTVPLEWMREAAKEILDSWIDAEPFTEDEVCRGVSRIIARHSPGWVKIEEGKPEKLPRVEVDVLCYLGSGDSIDMGFLGADKHWYTGDWERIIPTHWTFLPAPPSEGETK